MDKKINRVKFVYWANFETPINNGELLEFLGDLGEKTEDFARSISHDIFGENCKDFNGMAIPIYEDEDEA